MCGSVQDPNFRERTFPSSLQSVVRAPDRQYPMNAFAGQQMLGALERVRRERSAINVYCYHSYVLSFLASHPLHKLAAALRVLMPKNL